MSTSSRATYFANEVLYTELKREEVNHKTTYAKMWYETNLNMNALIRSVLICTVEQGVQHLFAVEAWEISK